MNLQDVQNSYNFADCTIVITGGAGVLGSEIACTLVGCGAKVAILDRDLALAEKLVQRFPPAAADRVIAVYGDVLQRDSLEQAREVIVRQLGPVDVLINAAGGNKPAATTTPDRSFFDLPEDALRFVFDLNMLGTFLPTQIFGALMAQRGEGTILNVSSMNAFRPLTRIPAYSAAKAGISNFTQWLAVYMAQEYSPRIRVNAIAPGFFLTEQNRFLLTDEHTGALILRGEAIMQHTPLQRFGRPEDLLGAVLWLLSPLAAFVSGVIIPIDGGFSAYSGV
jgi:NAD(P)-dependent dehydrogenase (short-subunit alcohol dehydrogenase family)